MRNTNRLVLAIPLALAAGAVYADLKGTVESVDANARSFVVQGITVTTDERTEYEDGLSQFEDIQPNQQVEVDLEIQDGRHIAEEVELEEPRR